MMAGLSVSIVCLLCFAGVVVDAVAGEPSRFHPLVAFGRWAACIERAGNPHAGAAHRSDTRGPAASVARTLPARVSGVAAWALAVIPPVAVLVMLTRWLPAMLAWPLHVAALWFALGARSLIDHIAPVEAALHAGDLAHARALTSRVVTRDLSDADESAVSRAAI